MALPYDEGKAFIRDPKNYPHDAFGADTGGRTIPHTGIDISPITRGDTTVNVRSVWGGTVVEAGFDKESGNYVIIHENDGAFWGYGHNSVNLVTSGVVKAGQPIARLGATGGAKGVHCHIWRATNLAAARRIVHGFTNYKSGRTTAQWAASMGGLTDPLPHIYKSLEVKEDEMLPDERNAVLSTWKAVFHGGGDAGPRSILARLDDIEAKSFGSQKVSRKRGVFRQPEDDKTYNISAIQELADIKTVVIELLDRLETIENADKKLDTPASMVNVDVDDALLGRIAKAVADELHKRSAE